MPKPLKQNKTHLEKYLFIKKSLIPGAGNGLYTKVNIDKHTVVTEYFGEKISNTIGAARFILKQSHSIIYLNQKYCIDSTYDKSCMATFINDANGLFKIKGIKNNAFSLNSNGRLYIISKRKINAGEELFIEYGSNYWKAINHYKIFE
jgi:hypothetical protein